MLRGSRDFESRLSYAEFLRHLFRRLNAGRARRLAEELAVLQSLPARRLEAMKRDAGPGHGCQHDPGEPQHLLGQQPPDR